MKHNDSNRARGRGAPLVPAPPLPAFVEMDPSEAAEYGEFRDNVELEDVLEAGEPTETEPGKADGGV